VVTLWEDWMITRIICFFCPVLLTAQRKEYPFHIPTVIHPSIHPLKEYPFHIPKIIHPLHSY